MGTGTGDPLDPFGWVGATAASKYRVDAVVAEGGFGVVYRAHHLGFDTTIALKCLKLPARLQGAEREDFLRAFVEEGRLLHQLSRATVGIVQAMDVGADTSPNGTWTPYLALEWLDGVTLEEDLAARAAAGLSGRTLAEAIALLEPAARALAVAHERGIAHRDIKPANLFVTDLGGRRIVKVVDFGIAKVMTEAKSLTRALQATGASLQAFTPQYGSPEQFDRTRYGATGPWSDVFAFALVLVEVLSGRVALDGGDTTQLFISSVHPARRPTPRQSGVHVPDAVEAVMTRAVAVEPRDRFHTAAEFWDALVAACSPVSSKEAFVAAARGSGLPQSNRTELAAPGSLSAASSPRSSSTTSPHDAQPPARIPPGPPSLVNAIGNSPHGGGPPAGLVPKRPPSRIMWKLVAPGAAVVLLLGAAVEGAHLVKERQRAQAEVRRKADPLYIPCIGKLATDLPASAKATDHTDFTCADGRIEVNVSDKRTDLFFFPSDQGGLSASKLSGYVTSVLPNLGVPTLSRAAPCRGLLSLTFEPDDTTEARLASAAMTYKMANALVDSYERMGGSRFAEWRFGNTVVYVENFIDHAHSNAPAVLINVADAKAPSEAENRTGSDVPWNDTAICERHEAPYLTALRTKLLAAGWWFDDAEAFMSAAKAVGRPQSADTADEVFVVARLLLASKEWADPQRALVGRGCLAPAIKTAGKGVSVPYDTVAGIDKGFNWVIAPAAPSGAAGVVFADRSGYEQEVHRFDAMIGTAAHAKCALEHLRAAYSPWKMSPSSGEIPGPMLEPFGFTYLWRTDKVSSALWKRSWVLASDARFGRELFAALARARGGLILLPGNASAPGAPTASSTHPVPAPSVTAVEASAMAAIAGGTFLMGSPDAVGDQHEHPQHRVTVAPFRMDLTEVTVSAYQACVQSGGCTPAATDSPPCNYGHDDKGDHPINCVDWTQADTFCRAQGKRLPSEEEWEYAALGSDGRVYPWGNDAPAGHLCWKGAGGTCPVGSFPTGRSPFGLQDMAGNVWEWTSDFFSDDYGQSRSDPRRVTRGGAWLSNQASDVRGANRGKVTPSHRPNIIGFRCASDALTPTAAPAHTIAPPSNNPVPPPPRAEGLPTLVPGKTGDWGAPPSAAPPFDRGAGAGALGGVDVATCKLADGPTGLGHISVTFSPDGSVGAAEVDQPPFAGTAVGDCAAAKFRQIRVPAFAGGAVKVGKAFIIN